VEALKRRGEFLERGELSVMSRRPIRFLSSVSEFEKYGRGLKGVKCPWCGRFGFVVGHGRVRGYLGCGDLKDDKGKRYRCDNRNRRGGCGRTY